MNSNIKPDIFDRLMQLPVLHLFEPFYKKHREVLLYLFFGGLAFFLNIFLFITIQHTLAYNELWNNVLCWIICVLFQFFTNRTWVFKNTSNKSRTVGIQLWRFFMGRVFTLVVEEIILAVFITWLMFPTVAVKLAALFIVIVLNYVISKYRTFKK